MYKNKKSLKKDQEQYFKENPSRIPVIVENQMV